VLDSIGLQQVELVEADVHSLNRPEWDRSFDLAILPPCPAHQENPEKTLRCDGRLIRADGHVVYQDILDEPSIGSGRFDVFSLADRRPHEHTPARPTVALAARRLEGRTAKALARRSVVADAGGRWVHHAGSSIAQQTGRRAVGARTARVPA
jgi:hypothetical protein